MGDGWAGFKGEVCEADVSERCAVVFVNDILWLCLGAMDGMWGMYYVVVVVVGGVGVCGGKHLWGGRERGGDGGADKTAQKNSHTLEEIFSSPQQIITRSNLKFLIAT